MHAVISFRIQGKSSQRWILFSNPIMFVVESIILKAHRSILRVKNKLIKTKVYTIHNVRVVWNNVNFQLLNARVSSNNFLLTFAYMNRRKKFTKKCLPFFKTPVVEITTIRFMNIFLINKSESKSSVSFSESIIVIGVPCCGSKEFCRNSKELFSFSLSTKSV